MEVLSRFFGNKADLLEQALSKAAQRHSALASNLANVNTPGYRRQDLDFNIRIEEAGKIARRGIRGGIRGARGNRGPNSGGDNLRANGNSVDLEREVTALAETQLRYDAVSMMSRRYFQGLKDVIREGR